MDSGKYSYNSWPLGKLQKELRRQEPEAIKELGYNWSDARDIIDMFENKVANFAGSKFCISTDSASNALYLCLKFLNYKGEISIPEQTYVSVAMQILHAGNKLNFHKENWKGAYYLRPTKIIDGAGRFAPLMYEDKHALHVLSFQIKKRLPIGRGGAILTDDLDAATWLRRARYDGRDLETPYDSKNHVDQIGWHFYMTPEDAARGLILFELIGNDYSDTMMSTMYPPLTQYRFFENSWGE